MNRMGIVSLFILFAFMPQTLAQEEWAGADSLAQEKISEIAPDYEPRFAPVWEPPGEIESLLFSLQAALGALVIGLYIGYHKGKASQNR